MDDDIAVDFIRIFEKLWSTALLHSHRINILDEKPPVKIPSSMWGYIQTRLPVQRNLGWKWALSKNEYDREFHPNFLSGWAYITTPSTAEKLVNASRQCPIMWIDDVWVTGILAAKANIKLESLNSFYTFYKEHIECCTSNRTLECDFLIGPSENDLNVIRNFAKHSINCWKFSYSILKRLNNSNSVISVCQRRTDGMEIRRICHVPNPYFLPDTPGIGEVL